MLLNIIHAIQMALKGTISSLHCHRGRNSKSINLWAMFTDCLVETFLIQFDKKNSTKDHSLHGNTVQERLILILKATILNIKVN